MNQDLFIDLKIFIRLPKAGILLVGLRKKGVKGGGNKESSKSESQVWMLIVAGYIIWCLVQYPVCLEHYSVVFSFEFAS